jgi:hypothetical protein
VLGSLGEARQNQFKTSPLHFLGVKMVDLTRLLAAIDEWAKTEFPNAYLKQHASRESYRYTGVTAIYRFWKSADGIMVEAAIQFEIDPEGEETERISLQLDNDYKVIGFDLTKIEH